MKNVENELVDLRQYLVVDDCLERGQLCISDEDCEIAESINREMESVCRKYSSMSEQSIRLSAGLRFSV